MFSLISKSLVMEKTIEVIKKIALYDADVLIHGETGTGKEVVAQFIHKSSDRKNERFVAINCCAIPDEMLESELFGHEAGAFTGANRRRVGKFEFAHKGTLFLDEIDSMSVHMQTKLLRVLQERSVERLGSNELIPLDIRVIASTKKDLLKASNEGGFREDLFYRLNIFNVYLPPLCDRADDILILFQFFLSLACVKHGVPVPLLTEELVENLLAHKWPGNVRELRNISERFALGCELNIDDAEAPSEEISKRARMLSLGEKVAIFEKTLIENELRRNSWNIQATYKMLQLPRKTLYERMKKFGLVRDRVKLIA